MRSDSWKDLIAEVQGCELRSAPTQELLCLRMVYRLFRKPARFRLQDGGLRVKGFGVKVEVGPVGAV